MSAATPYRPAPPKPTRLNRVALLAFGLLIVVSAVVGLLSVHDGGPHASVDAAPPLPRPVSPQSPSLPDPAPDSVVSHTSPVIAGPPRTIRNRWLVRRSLPLDTALHAVSRYVLEPGTVIPALLVTEIRSTLPGLVVAQVERDVYDTPTGRLVLIPRGSRLIGQYDSPVAQGDDALRVVWTRLAFPDGRWLALPGFEAADAGGTSGLRGTVNSHVARAYVDAGLMSIVGAGAQLSQPPASVPYGVASPGQVVAGSLGQQVTEESLERLRSDARLPPTITVRAGTSFVVMVARDVVFDRPY